MLTSKESPLFWIVTKKGRRLKVYPPSFHDVDDKRNVNKYLRGIYGEESERREADLSYNCHGLTFIGKLGWFASPPVEASLIYVFWRKEEVDVADESDRVGVESTPDSPRAVDTNDIHEVLGNNSSDNGISNDQTQEAECGEDSTIDEDTVEGSDHEGETTDDNSIIGQEALPPNEQILAFLNDNGYRSVQSFLDIREETVGKDALIDVGDIVLYKTGDTIDHSAIIAKYEGFTWQVLSKFGIGGEYFHPIGKLPDEDVYGETVEIWTDKKILQ